MAHFEKDDLPTLSETHEQRSDELVDSNHRRLVSRTPSASISIPMVSMEPNEREISLEGHTGPLHSVSSMEGNPVQARNIFIILQNPLCGYYQGFGRKLFSLCSSYVPPVMDPRAESIQQWNKFLAVFCFMAIYLDPLFFFLIYVQKDHKCIVINWTFTKILVSLRSMNDFIYFLNILLQFRLDYVSPAEAWVVRARNSVNSSKEIALHYLRRYFLLDFFVVLPLPQIMILCVLPNSLGSSGANYAKNLLRTSILVQYIPRLFRFLPLLIGQSPTGFTFESAWANIIINLLIFMLSGHVVGSCWYLFGLQRVNQCLRDACHKSNIDGCITLIDCGRASPQTSVWFNNTDAIDCLNSSSGAFSYGIYASAVELTIETKVVNKYVYALFWGFQQISTLAGNLTPSKFVLEVLFTMAIIGLGLLLFAFLIGNIQNFLQGLGRRRLEKQLRGRDVEEWMSHCRLPKPLRRRVRQAERHSWAATRGVNEEMLLENFPEDLRTDIRRHLFEFLNKVQIFAMMDDPILDAVCERLKQKTYIKGSRILTQGGLVDKIVFVVCGKLESSGENGMGVSLSKCDACGEELLTWYLEHSSVSTDGKIVRLPGQKLLSNRTVRCLTNVEALSLRAADLEELTTLFPRFFRDPRVQEALLRYESPYWRSLAATRTAVAWRYRKKRLSRANFGRVGQAERYSWAATRGHFENLPEDLRTDIRRHLFKFVKKVRIFALMEEPIVDVICERLKQKTYIKGSRILTRGVLVDKIVFVVRGKLESIGENGMGVSLSKGDACGEELLTWYIEHSSVSTDGKIVRLPGQKLLSNRTVGCLTNVEALSLRAADLEELTTLFTRFLHVQGALRSLAANRIQVAWRYRKKSLSRANTSQSVQTLKS